MLITNTAQPHNPTITTASTVHVDSNISKVKEAAIKILSEIVQESQKISRPVTEIEMLPIFRFLKKCRDVLGEDCEILNAIYKNLPSINPSSMGMLVAAYKTALSSSQTQAEAYQDLIASVSFFQSQNNYLMAYYLRTLYCKLALLDATQNGLALNYALQLEQEHLESVVYAEGFPGTKQERYNAHLESYLDLLSKWMGIPVNEEQSLQEKYRQIATGLKERSNRTTGEDKILLNRSMAFLRSRPEWWQYSKKGYAAYLLREACKLNQTHHPEVKLDLLMLETSRLARHELSEYPKTAIVALFKQINEAAKTFPPAFECMTSLLKVQLLEVMLKCGYECGDTVKKIKKALCKAVEGGEAQHNILDFRSLHALAECYFLHGFYFTLCYENMDEFNQGLKSLKCASQSVWGNPQIRMGSERLLASLESLHNPPASCLIEKQRVFLLEKLKYCLQDKIHELILTYWESKKNIDLSGGGEGSHCIWEKGPQGIVALFLNNKTKEADKLIGSYLLTYEKRAQKLVRNTLIKPFFATKDELDFVVDLEVIENFLTAAKDCPMSGFNFVCRENEILDNSKIYLNVLENNPNAFTPCLTSLHYFHDRFMCVWDALNCCQGDMAYNDLTREILYWYVDRIRRSKLLSELLDRTITRRSGPLGKAIDALRHNYNEIVNAIALISLAYPLCDFYTSSPSTLQHLWHCTEQSSRVGAILSNTNESKSRWLDIYQMNASDKYLAEGSSSALVSHWMALCYAFMLHPDTVKREALKNQLFKEMPDSYEALVKLIPKSSATGPDQEAQDVLLEVGIRKALNMIEHLQVEKGKDYLIKCYDHLIKINPHLQSGRSIKLSFICEPFDLSRMKYNQPLLTQAKSSQSVKDRYKQADESAAQVPFLPTVSETGAIKKEARDKIRKQEIKKEKQNEKKQNAKSDESASNHSTNAAQISSITAPGLPKKEVSKDTYALLSRLLTMTKSSPIDGPWELRSYRGDITMTRHEIFQLITGLGGSITPGKGSHVKGHLAEIKFNGKDLGSIVDYNSGQLITLTKGDHTPLDYYQIDHARTIILSQGYNLDTVILKGSS